MMPTDSEFRALVAQAYEHLYDLVYLRCHPLADLLCSKPVIERKERAWALHHLLLHALDEIDPGPTAPASSLEVRRHQLMVLRYADGLDPQATSDRLAISRRHFYREHEAALDAVAQVLWQRYLDAIEQPTPPETAQPAPDRVQLLRQETLRVAQTDHYAHLHEVLPGVVSLLTGRLCQHNLALETLVSLGAPPIGLDRNLLRQLLLAALSFIAERCTDATLALRTDVDETHVQLWLLTSQSLETRDVALVDPLDPVDPVDAVDADGEQELTPGSQTPDEPLPESLAAALAPVHELASLGQTEVRLLHRAGKLEGLALRLPRAPERTILVVDDNPDALEFFQRVLPYHGYRVVSAVNGREALQHAQALSPHVIVLDVMLPEQDGWEVLQVLRNHPETQAIPVVICSVLRASELALSMGASAFLAKPMSEEALLGVLRGLAP
jgi:CheY-like chemotaxis protein